MLTEILDVGGPLSVPASVPATARAGLSPLNLNLAVTLYLLAVPNSGLWERMNTVFAGSPLALIGFALALAGLTMATLSLVTLRHLHRPALAVLIVIAAGADHFQRNYGVLIDREMIQNAMLTTATESQHLLTRRLVVDLLLFGLLPGALIFLPRVRRRPVAQALWRYPLAIILSIAIMVAALLSDFKTYSAAVREHRDMMVAYQPGATLAAVARYAKMRWLTSRQIAAPLGSDARPGPFLSSASKPVLLVIFAGETARAQNFGLNGYARDTTPELAGLDVVNFPDTASCGTSTAVSLPCMFSALGQARYSQLRFLGQENLLDVLTHAGLQVDWVDNNTGDQRIATRTGARRVDAMLDPAACESGECTDAALLPVLRDTMQHMTEDTVLVLHMIGSHGPAYHLRYPPEAEQFAPACQSNAFADCTDEEIVNAYDNSIRFTDHVLAEAIRMMAAEFRVTPAMIYLSDHGESLGEGGLYLHAAPMFMAPETQRKVPFLMWLSGEFQQDLGVQQSCIARRASEPQSQDVLFHTVLGLLDIQTEARDPGLDLTSGCRIGA